LWATEAFLRFTTEYLQFAQVPDLFTKDELATLLEAMAPAAKKAGCSASQAEVYAFFVEQSRRNLHIVFAMSPVGDAFRSRLRQFPSLVSCTTIDWFPEWPEEALRSVADYMLQVHGYSLYLRGLLQGRAPRAACAGASSGGTAVMLSSVRPSEWRLTSRSEIHAFTRI
jgi:P-loop containing dynein motor region D4